VNLPPETERLPGGRDLVHAVLIGGGAEALSWVPRLFRDPQINLLGLLPTHPADLIRNLEPHGYALEEAGPLHVFAATEQIAELPRLDLIIDTTMDPSTLRRLGEAGLDGVPRVNASALRLLLARPAGPASGAAPPHRNAFAQRLTKELGRAYRHGRTLGLIRVEVSGNGAGEPLAEATVDAISQAIEQSLRIEDVVAYLPNGVFAVLLPETGEATRYVAGRLTSNLANLRIRSDPGAGAEPAAEPGETAGEEPGEKAGKAGPGLRQAVGWAWFPQDAKTAQALMDQAKGRMGGRSPLGRRSSPP
jgi:GGDEF domain-containing protein